MPQRQQSVWEEVSSGLFTQLRELRGSIPAYSYEDAHAAAVTDEKLCALLKEQLSQAKRAAYSVSDILFSLQAGDQLLPLTDLLRDEIDIFADEITIRHCEWRDVPAAFLRKVVIQDVALVRGSRKLNRNLEVLFNGILTAMKRKKQPGAAFWKKAIAALKAIRLQVRDLAVLFRERDVMCNISPLTLERTFAAIQREIRETV